MELENTKKILVMSGKGGVGKTTIAVNLAVSLAGKGSQVGLMDIDIHGPNAAKMLGVKQQSAFVDDNNKILPIEVSKNLKMISIQFFSKKEDEAMLWRGVMKHKAIFQFIKTINWGELDYLVVDFPPGTGDEYITTGEMIGKNAGCVIVSTPQQVSILDAKRSLKFSERFKIPIIGLIENMAGEVFGKGSVEKFAKEQKLNFLGRIELDKTISKSSDDQKPFVMSDNKMIKDEFEAIVKEIINFWGNENK